MYPVCSTIEGGSRSAVPVSQRALRLLHPNPTHRDRFPPQDNEALRATRHEAHKHMAQDLLDLIRLLDPNAHAHRVDRGLDHHAFIVISRDGQWC